MGFWPIRARAISFIFSRVSRVDSVRRKSQRHLRDGVRVRNWTLLVVSRIVSFLLSTLCYLPVHFLCSNFVWWSGGWFLAKPSCFIDEQGNTLMLSLFQRGHDYGGWPPNLIYDTDHASVSQLSVTTVQKYPEQRLTDLRHGKPCANILTIETKAKGLTLKEPPQTIFFFRMQFTLIFHHFAVAWITLLFRYNCFLLLIIMQSCFI